MSMSFRKLCQMQKKKSLKEHLTRDKMHKKA